MENQSERRGCDRQEIYSAPSNKRLAVASVATATRLRVGEADGERTIDSFEPQFQEAFEDYHLWGKKRSVSLRPWTVRDSWTENRDVFL